MCSRIFPRLARPTSQERFAAARLRRVHLLVSAKTNRPRVVEVAAAVRQAEAEEALRLEARPLLEGAVQALQVPRAAPEAALLCAEV